MIGLYIHIPFCEQKCAYCAFYSHAGAGRDLQARFFQTLEKEIRELPADFDPQAIFIGGGTPSALDCSILEKLLSVLQRFSPQEFSVEVNPGTVDSQKLARLKRSGVSRLSIGVQSFDIQCLEMLGRIHSAEEADAAFQLARSAGFENISIDLMFGVPGQTMKMLERDVDQALALEPEHISIYNLMLEEGTPLAESEPTLPDEELELAMYNRIRERLKAAGFVHYEISNFAKPGFECVHNMLYWTGGEYMGVGPAAHSHWKGVRWANVSDVDDYCANGPRREFEEHLAPEAKARETLVMGLRLVGGVEVPEDLWKKTETDFRSLEERGLLLIDGRNVCLSEDALFVSDAVFAELV